MSDFHYVELHAQFAGFRVLVLANRFGCNDDFSRAAHDKLLEKLDQLIALARRAVAAECRLALTPGGPETDDLGEEIWSVGHHLAYGWGDPKGRTSCATTSISRSATTDWTGCARSCVGLGTRRASGSTPTRPTRLTWARLRMMTRPSTRYGATGKADRFERQEA